MKVTQTASRPLWTCNAGHHLERLFCWVCSWGHFTGCPMIAHGSRTPAGVRFSPRAAGLMHRVMAPNLGRYQGPGAPAIRPTSAAGPSLSQLGFRSDAFSCRAIPGSLLVGCSSTQWAWGASATVRLPYGAGLLCCASIPLLCLTPAGQTVANAKCLSCWFPAGAVSVVKTVILAIQAPRFDQQRIVAWPTSIVASKVCGLAA